MEYYYVEILILLLISLAKYENKYTPTYILHSVLHYDRYTNVFTHHPDLNTFIE